MIPSLEDLPPPPPGKSGWPWTEAGPAIAESRPDGAPWPKISIVTPSFNYGQFLEETIRSVLLQGYPDLEYFVLDGGSSDGSADIIERYSPWLAYWHSRRDAGQADAINSALGLATGLWFHNVNADDVLLPGALAAIGAAPADADLLLGDVVNFDGTEERTIENREISPEYFLGKRKRNGAESWHQPGVVFKRQNLHEIGGYVRDLKYVFDRHTTCLYIEKHPNAVCLNALLVKYRVHSSQISHFYSDAMVDDDIKSLKGLSKELFSSRLRALAKFSYVRTVLYKKIIIANSQDDFKYRRDVLLYVLNHPGLAVNRFFLGDIRRNPSMYMRCLLP
jgi:glycosyltransferase involved in cell wall biosynthesis